MRCSNILAGAKLALLVPGSSVLAASVTKYVEFTASGFTSFYAPDGTVTYPAVGDPTVSGAFTVTLDPTLLVKNVTAGIVLDSLSIALGSALSFSYDPLTGLLNVGGIASNDAAGPVLNTQIVQYDPATNDFWFQIDNFLATSDFRQFGFAQTAIPSTLFYTVAENGGSGSVSVRDVVAPVPLPASLPLVVTALGLGVLAGRRRRRKA